METTLTKLRTASFFGAFTTPPKIAIIKALLSGPLHVAAIQQQTGISQPVVSQMLTQLRTLGIVYYTQAGTRRYYQLEHPEKVGELIAIAESLAA